jgi:hypothetical protein
MIINDDWRLVSDELNIVLMHKRSHTTRFSKIDAPDSYDLFYYGTIAYALQSLLQKEINGTGLKDVVAINERITKINQDIQKAVEKLTRKDLVEL